MGIESSRFRGIFAPEEIVELKQICFTPTGVFQPGQYKAEELPDIAFEMGLVEKASSMNDQSNNPSNQSQSS
ncbi:MAG: hypothetical protein WBA77_17400 [Microcoleaceae cyanobacterium]